MTKYDLFKTIPQCYFLYYNQYKNISHNIFSLYNVHSNMFWHLCVNLKEFQNLCFTKLYKFLELKQLKLQYHKVITTNYYLPIAEWYTIVCTMLQYLAKAVCLCDCIYNPLLLLFVCWSGVPHLIQIPTEDRSIPYFTNVFFVILRTLLSSMLNWLHYYCTYTFILTTTITLQRFRNYFSLDFVQYSLYQKIVQ